jgi:hypothetical protein
VRSYDNSGSQELLLVLLELHTLLLLHRLCRSI